MHVDHNMHVIGWNMHVTCTLFRIGKLELEVREACCQVVLSMSDRRE